MVGVHVDEWIRKLLRVILCPSKYFALSIFAICLLWWKFLPNTQYYEFVMKLLTTGHCVIEFGRITVTVYDILRVFVLSVIVFYCTSFLSKIGDKLIGNISELSIYSRSLLIRVYQILIYVIASIFILQGIGVRLDTLSYFSGAIGIGIGLGLQKIASNFISGLLILIERSVKAGDYIEFESGVYGKVEKVCSRYTLLASSNGGNFILPNDYWISNRVKNLTYSGDNGRIDFTVKVLLSADLVRACDIILSVMLKNSSVLKEPVPICFVEDFDHYGANLVGRFWIAGTFSKMKIVKSEVLLTVWNAFKENGIEMVVLTSIS